MNQPWSVDTILRKTGGLFLRCVSSVQMHVDGIKLAIEDTNI
jgi:hypothetical protein